jgi:hypothetical protein
MSCDAISLSFSLWMAAFAPAVGGPAEPAAQMAVVAPPSVSREPLFSDIVVRAAKLKRDVERLREAAPVAGDLGPLPGFEDFSREIAALSALDMEGHLELARRGVVDDLKCILRGIAQDLPVKLQEVAQAKDARARDLALRDMHYLLNDNVEVITSPPRPAA